MNATGRRAPGPAESADGDVEARVREALAGVADPEIPVVSIADLGLVERVEVTLDAVEVTLLPTWAGCPALEAIHADVVRALRAPAGGRAVRVRYALSPAWTTERITDAGREALRGFGIAPPDRPEGRRGAAGPVTIAIGVRCPMCGSLDTTLDAAFGPTPCRSIRYCNACRNPFEGFKAKG